LSRNSAPSKPTPATSTQQSHARNAMVLGSPTNEHSTGNHPPASPYCDADVRSKQNYFVPNYVKLHKPPKQQVKPSNETDFVKPKNEAVDFLWMDHKTFQRP
jgi:hypothetical protein